MKDTTNTARVAGYLAKMFRVLNEHYFGNKLEEPIITIQSTPRAYGHVTVSKVWHKANGEQCRELRTSFPSDCHTSALPSPAWEA